MSRQEVSGLVSRIRQMRAVKREICRRVGNAYVCGADFKYKGAIHQIRIKHGKEVVLA